MGQPSPDYQPRKEEWANPPPGPSPGERFTKLVANLLKLAGGILGFLEALNQARPSVLLFATALFMGAQAVEDMVLKIIDRAMEK